MIRGRVGSDVYSIGKNASGRKQQIVRSLAEQVANPQTLAQMRGRMIMSTVMQAVSSMAIIVDHSFDGYAAGQPCISHFISRNYDAVKADVAAHPESGNAFGMNAYQEKGAKPGAYIVADGSAKVPAALVFDSSNNIVLDLSEADLTIGSLKALLGMTNEEYFTIVGFSNTLGFAYQRFRINPALTDATEIDAENIGTIFVGEGNLGAVVSLAGNVITITSGLDVCRGIIVSLKSATGYKHNKCILTTPTAPQYTAAVALATYPVGAQRFLNGGDQANALVVGTGDGSGDGTSGETASLTSVTVDGSSLAKGGTSTITPSAQTQSVVISAAMPALVGRTYKLRIVNKASGATVGSDQTFAEGAASGTWQLSSDTTYTVQLLAGNSVIEQYGDIKVNVYDASTAPGEGD